MMAPNSLLMNAANVLPRRQPCTSSRQTGISQAGSVSRPASGRPLGGRLRRVLYPRSSAHGWSGSKQETSRSRPAGARNQHKFMQITIEDADPATHRECLEVDRFRQVPNSPPPEYLDKARPAYKAAARKASARNRKCRRSPANRQPRRCRGSRGQLPGPRQIGGAVPQTALKLSLACQYIDWRPDIARNSPYDNPLDRRFRSVRLQRTGLKRLFKYRSCRRVLA